MISARQFCQEPGYPVTIFLTYSFDPLFFERIALDDLSMGGTRRILILADANEVSEAINRCRGQAFYLGRRYTLAESRQSNVFHPKLIARLSPDGGRIWIGSGNLTYTGWGGNHELATAWSVGPGREDNGAWLQQALQSVSTLTGSASFQEQLKGVLSSISWLGSATDVSPISPVILGMPHNPLAPQLARRWKGRRFDTVKIFTGSTDVDGAFLRWAHNSFGLRKATICLTPPFASFDPVQLAKLPMKVRFVTRVSSRRIHAKFYWFSGPDGNAAIVGSANCSAAAWLADGAHGNVELVTIYDNPDRNAFAPILSTFDGKELLPEDVLTGQSDQISESSSGEASPSYRITSLRLRASGRTIEAVVEPEPDGVETALIVETKEDNLFVPMKLSDGRLLGRLSQHMSLGAETVFARMVIGLGSDRYTTPPRWIDNDRAIENAAHDNTADPSHEIFSGRGFGDASEQRIVAAIYSISSSLLRFDLGQPSSTKGGGNAPTAEPGADAPLEPAGPADPSRLTYSLDDNAANQGAPPDHHSKLHGVSLKGVISLLFARENEAEIDLSQERWSADEPEKLAPAGEVVTDTNHHSPKPQAPRSSAEALKALSEEIARFMLEMGKPSFAETCPVSALTQALAFPILLGVKGNEEGWLSDEKLASIARRVADVMFTKRYGAGRPVGLLNQVKDRYSDPERRTEFWQTVGDGTIHTILLAALAKPEAKTLPNLVLQAKAIYQVMECPDLIAAVHLDQLTSLSQSVIIADAEFAVNTRARALSVAFGKLVTSLQNWDRVHPARASRTTMHRAGSVLWSCYGLEVRPPAPAEAYSAGVNLEILATEEVDVRAAIEGLWHSMGIRRVQAEAIT